MDDVDRFFAELESKGEDEVRKSFGKLVYERSDKIHYLLTEKWLKSKADARAAEAALRKEAREEESLSISRKAMRNSIRATTIAIMAIALSVVMAIQKVIEWRSH